MGKPNQDRLKRILDGFSQSSLVRRILRNSAYLFSANGFSAAAGFLQGIFIARMLGIADFGILGTITLFTGVVNNLASFRMDELVIKYVGHFVEVKDEQRAAAIFKSAALTEMVSSCVAYGLVCLLAPLAAAYFAQDTTLTTWFYIYGLVVLFNLITESATGLLRIFDRFKRMAALNAAQAVVTLVLTVIVFSLYQWLPSTLSIAGQSLSPLMAVVLVYMAGKLLGALGLAYLALDEAQRVWGGAWWRVRFGVLREQTKELARFAISTNLSATINLINKDSELLWVAYFRNPFELGAYRLALSLVNLVQMPVNPMPNATYPELARETAHRNWGNVRHILRQGSLLAGGYTLLASIAILIFGQPFIKLAYTAEFLPAYPALLIMLVGFLAANTFYWNRVTLLAFGLPEYLTKVNFVAAIFKVIGYLVLIPTFGYLGCAALLAGYYIFSSAVNVLKARQTLRDYESQDVSPLSQSAA